MSSRLSFEDLLAQSLPKLETSERCLQFRRDVRRADQWRISRRLDLSLVPLLCEEVKACGSGLCPVCMRQARLNMLRLAYDRCLFEGEWKFVTIFVEGWVIEPGDHRAFGKLKDHAVVGRLRQALHRSGIPDVFVIGGVETVWKVIDNKKVGKPFHLHLLVRGMTEEQIKVWLYGHLPLDQSVPRPLDIKPVGASEGDFMRALSYCFKQPFWKSSKIDSGDLDRWLQWPKKDELAELISNLGGHPVYGRLFTMSTSKPSERLRPRLVCHAATDVESSR